MSKLRLSLNVIMCSDVSEMPIDIFEGIDNVPEEYKAQVLSYVRRRLAPQPIKIRADVEVTCFTYEGSLRTCHAYAFV